MSSQQDKDKLISLSLEREVIASLLKNPDLYYEVEATISDKDFAHPFHATCFCVIRDAYHRKEKIDKVTISHSLINLGLNRCEEVDTFAYIENISYIQVNMEMGRVYCSELSKLRLLRELIEQNYRAREYILSNRDKHLDDIVLNVDKLNNEVLRKHDFQTKPINIFDNIRQVTEDRADNPLVNFLMGPFNSINKIYGTILPPAGINLIAARTGVAKTAWSMFYAIYVAQKYNLPILHLDFSEMTMEQLQFRAICIFTQGKVPYHTLVKGTWKDNPDYVKLVSSVWPKVKKLKMYYYDIGNLSRKDIISLIRRFYYGVIGRGNDFIINYDYLKPFGENHNLPEWKEMGHFIQEYKSLVNNEIPFARTNMGIQVNRSGIIGNKTTSTIDDTENTFTMSDRIVQQVTSAWLLRRKLNEELVDEGNRFGNLKMIPTKFREVLGDDYTKHFQPVKMLDGSLKSNYINLNMSSFNFEDMGDLNHMVKVMSNIVSLQKNQSDDINI